MLANFTRHALQRLQQRGKSRESIRLILRYGKRQKQFDRVFLSRRRAEKEIQRRRRWLARLERRQGNRRAIDAIRRRVKTLERVRGCVVVQKTDMIITIYHTTRRTRT